MANADYSYVSKVPGTIALYQGGEEIRNIRETDSVQTLIQLI